MQVKVAHKAEQTHFITRASIFMPLLIITQVNAGIYMVFGGPYVNRLFNVRASVLIMRQIVCAVILLLVNLLTRKIDMKVVTKRDVKYFFLCGKSQLFWSYFYHRNIWYLSPLVLYGFVFLEHEIRSRAVQNVCILGKLRYSKCVH